MKKLLSILILCLVLTTGVLAAKTFTGFTGHLQETIATSSFNQNWNPGEVALPDSIEGKRRLLADDSETTADFNRRSVALNRLTLNHREGKYADCLNGEYRLKNEEDGHFFGAEKCVRGRWRTI